MISTIIESLSKIYSPTLIYLIFIWIGLVVGGVGFFYGGIINKRPHMAMGGITLFFGDLILFNATVCGLGQL